MISGKFESPVIGIYRRNSHEVMDIRDCPLHHPLVNRIAAAVREGIRKGKVTIYNPRTRNGILRYLVVRVSQSEGKAMVVFVTSQRSFNEIHHLAKHVKSAVPEVEVAAQNVNASSETLSSETETISSPDSNPSRTGSVTSASQSPPAPFSR